MGQRNFRLFLDSNKKLSATIKTDNGLNINALDIPNSILKENLWYHVALKYSSNAGSVALYLNGKIIWNYIDNTLIGTTIDTTPEWNSNHDFEIGRNTQFDNNYFEGSIYESRVYKKALTQSQLHQQINQEIVNNNGSIRGSVIPKDIEDLLWSDLILYYKMKHADTGYVPDLSNSNFDGGLNNMTIFQEQQDYTAPLPYETTLSCNGNWSDPSNWLYGDVWDITTDIASHSIAQINGNLEVDADITTTGLIITTGSNLKVNENSGLYNSWYLKLDGTLDLEGESQLIQSENSTLDIASSGILEKDLQGTADKFTYNYWSSPVGKTSNNSNNNDYRLRDIFTSVNFLTNGYDGEINPISISDYWIWKFNNRLSDNYSSWQHVRSSGKIFPGEGFTMKGPGSGSIEDEQNYTLQGKPNNGDINLTVYAGNDYLIGNPYPSELDAIKFIQDNKSSLSGTGATNGTLYFWKHWGGGSHIASEYQGGYATFSLSGGVPAASNISNSIIVSLGDSSSDVPGRYIPVGQGFYTTAETNGSINFNNSQRVFNVEENNIPAFGKGEISKNEASKSIDSRMKMRLGFKSINTLQRQLLITLDENATSAYDWGYDSKYIDTQIDDMYWLINNEKFLIQGTNQINKETIIPLGIHTKTDGFNSINIDELENTPNELEIYLHDKELGIYHNLKQSKYETFLVSGEYLDRFEVTFSKNNTLDIVENENKLIEVYFSNEKNRIVINNPTSKLIESVEMFNILGQTLFNVQSNSNNNHVEYNANQIQTGNYIIKIQTEFGMISKKVFVK